MTAVTVEQIAELTARIRRIQQLGSAVDPAERDAVLTEKRELLARLEEETQ